jgi:hypothetical protein
MKVVKHLLYVWSGCENHTMRLLSPNHCTKASFSTKQWPGILADFPNPDQPVWWQWHDDGSISPSTAYEGCQTPFICLEWMWEPYHEAFEPQPLHKHFIQHQAVTRDFSRLPKIRLTCLLVMAWWRIHIPIHSIWRLSNTFYMFGVDVKTIPCGFGASTTAQTLHSAPSSDSLNWWLLPTVTSVTFLFSKMN